MLGAMAYDRYMAICNPLHYKIRMSRSLCICLVTFPYFWGSMVGTMQVILTSHLSFCGSNTINHFYCADPPLLMLTCSDTYIKQTALFVSAGINLTGSLLIILIFYVFIFITIMRIHSSKGQHKAFSTCGSHLTAVTMFYGSLTCMYLRPANKQSVEQGKIVSVICIFVNPMLNLFIYSLRNNDVKQALRRIFMRNVGAMKKSSLLTVSQLKKKEKKRKRKSVLKAAPKYTILPEESNPLQYSCLENPWTEEPVRHQTPVHGVAKIWT